MATVATLRLGPADRGRTMSPAEYFDAEFRPGYRYELARGVLEVTRIPKPFPHGLIVYAFYRALGRYDLAHPGVIYRYGGAGEYHIWLPLMASGRNPDIGVTLANSPRDPEGDRVPTLAMEVVSRGARAKRRDYEVKRAEYLAYGIHEYWIVDPFARRITVLVRDGDAWDERVFVDGQTAMSVALPGFGVPVAEVWPVPEA